MNTKKLALTAILASLPALANAVVFEKEMLGQGTNDTYLTAQNLGPIPLAGLTVFGSRLDALPGANSVDFFGFSLASAAQISFTVTTDGGPSLTNDPMVGLFSASGVRLAYNDDNGVNWDSFLSQSLGPGNYYVAVTGYDDADFNSTAINFSDEGKSFAYALTIQAAPVPEPESYAMFLAGLGLLGAIARRRARK